MKNRYLLGGALLLVGAAVGFIVTRASLEPDPFGDVASLAESRSKLTAIDSIDGGASYFDQRLALEREFFDATSPGARRNALERMRRRGMDPESLLSMWARREPLECILLFTTDSNPNRKSALERGHLAVAFAALWQSDPALAEEMAMALPDRGGRSSAIGAIVSEAIASGGDAKALFGKYVEYLSESFFAMPDVDLAGVAPLLSGLPGGSHSVEIVRNFARRWVIEDQAAALAWAKSMPEGELRDWALGSLLNQVVMSRVGEAESLYAEILDVVPDFRPHGSTLAMMNRDRFADDPLGGIRWATHTLPLSDRGQFIGDLANSVIARDGAQAAIDLLPRVSPEQRKSLEDQIAARFGIDDPVAGIAWAKGLESKRADAALKGLAQAWVDGDLAAARTHLDDRETEAFPQLGGLVAKKWALQDPLAAVEWARELPADRAGDAHSAAVIAWSTLHSEDASTYAMTLPAGKERENLLYVTGANLIRTDLEGALNWLGGLEGEADRHAGRIAISVAASDRDRERLTQALGE